jgi:hypothetical protein
MKYWQIKMAWMTILFGLINYGIGCAVVYAPPIRSTMGSAPGKLTRGVGEFSVSGQSFIYNTPSATPLTAFGISDNVSIDLAGDFDLISRAKRDPTEYSGTYEGWAMGSAGMRVVIYEEEKENDLKVKADVEFGLGAGVGGSLDCVVKDSAYGPEGHTCNDFPNVDPHWTERFAYGGYFGLGYGSGISDNSSLYFRVRETISVAENTPLTFLTQLFFGWEWILKNQFSFHIGFGGGVYYNEIGSSYGWEDGKITAFVSGEAGVSILF